MARESIYDVGICRIVKDMDTGRCRVGVENVGVVYRCDDEQDAALFAAKINLYSSSSSYLNNDESLTKAQEMNDRLLNAIDMLLDKINVLIDITSKSHIVLGEPKDVQM